MNSTNPPSNILFSPEISNISDRTDITCILPFDIWNKILDSLPWHEFCCISLTCKEVKALTEKDVFWRPFLNKVFPEIITSNESGIKDIYIEEMKRIDNNIREKIENKNNINKSMNFSMLKLNYVFLERSHLYYTEKNVFMPPPDELDFLIPLTRDYLLCLGNARSGYKYAVQNIKLSDPPILEGSYFEYLPKSKFLIEKVNLLGTDTLQVVMLDLQKKEKIEKLVIPYTNCNLIGFNDDCIAIAHIPSHVDDTINQAIDIWNFNTNEKISSSVSLDKNQQIIKIDLNTFLAIKEERGKMIYHVEDKTVGLSIPFPNGIMAEPVEYDIDFKKLNWAGGQFSSFFHNTQNIGKSSELKSLASLPNQPLFSSYLNLDLDYPMVGSSFFYTYSSKTSKIVIRDKEAILDKIELEIPFDPSRELRPIGQVYYKYGRFFLVSTNDQPKGKVIVWDFL